MQPGLSIVQVEMIPYPHLHERCLLGHICSATAPKSEVSVHYVFAERFRKKEVPKLSKEVHMPCGKECCMANDQASDYRTAAAAETGSPVAMSFES